MNSRDLILQADRLADKAGYNQSEWSTVAGMATGGQGVSKLLSRGDCRVSTLLSLLRPLGMTLKIAPTEEEEKNDDE